jgi:acetoacetyl-CoA synthetase
VGDILWEPAPERVRRTLLHRFRETVPGAPETYEQLWQWSVDDLAAYWGKVWRGCGVHASRPPDEIMGEPRMPGTEWFAGAELNFAENLLRRRGDAVALIGAGEGRDDVTLSADDLRRAVANAQRALADLGVGVGDRVAALMPNCVETVVLMLATTSLGAVWSSCSPDFGVSGVLDRFGQIRPRVLFACDGYFYNGKRIDTLDRVREVLAGLDSVERVVVIPYASPDPSGASAPPVSAENEAAKSRRHTNRVRRAAIAPANAVFLP